METKDVLLRLRTEKKMTQDELAEKVFVTRQAVSRWEKGETTPNVETLKLLSGVFDVSINTLLGSPRQLICQCCGMPLEDGTMSRETDGSFNEDYCKWCYADGERKLACGAGAGTYGSGRSAAAALEKTAAGKLKQRHRRPVSLCAKTERKPVSRPRSQVRRTQRIHALYKLPIYESECGRYNKYRYEFPPDGTQNDNGGTEHGRKRTRTRGT